MNRIQSVHGLHRQVRLRVLDHDSCLRKFADGLVTAITQIPLSAVSEFSEETIKRAQFARLIPGDERQCMAFVNNSPVSADLAVVADDTESVRIVQFTSYHAVISLMVQNTPMTAHNISGMVVSATTIAAHADKTAPIL